MSGTLSQDRNRNQSDTSFQSIITREIPISKLFDLTVLIVVVFVAFYNLTSLDPDKSKVGLDKFVALKLLLTGFAGLIGLYGLVAIPRVFHLLTSPPGIWFTAVGSLYSVAALFGITPLVSLASSISLWCILLFTATAVVTQGPMHVVKAALAGISLFILASWFAYFVVPSLGIFAEPISEGRFTIRMAGIAHPNVLGQYAACGAGLIFVLWGQKEIKSKIWIGVAILCLAALVASISRASSAALMLALMFVYRDKLFKMLGPFSTIGILVILAGAVLVASTQFKMQSSLADQMLTPLSKSGDSTELTSMTGRTDIWSYAVTRLSERPWLGFGPATSKDILKDYSKYTHNLWLNVAFCGGVFAFLALFFLTIGRVFDSIFNPHRVADFIVIFIFVNGIAENLIFSFIPSVPTMLLFTASVWRLNEAISNREAKS